MPIINNNSDGEEHSLYLELYETLATWLGNTKLLHLINIIWHVYHINCILSSLLTYVTYYAPLVMRKTITSSYISSQTGNLLDIRAIKGFIRVVCWPLHFIRIILLSTDGLPHTTIYWVPGCLLNPRSLKLW